MSFDIASMDTRSKSEAGVAMPILHPKTLAPILNSDNKPVTITLKGRDSTAFTNAQREMNQRRADMEGRGIPYDDDSFDRDRLMLICACTVDWNFDSMDGQSFPYSEDNARKLWSDGRWKWLLIRAFDFVTQVGNFLAL